MKLTRATLAFTMQTATGPAGVVTEADGELRVDFDKRILWIGDEFVPLEAVRRCRPKKSEHSCIHCGQDGFANSQALGSHVSKKHGERLNHI